MDLTAIIFIVIWIVIPLIIFSVEKQKENKKKGNQHINYINSFEKEHEEYNKKYNWEYGNVPILDKNTGTINTFNLSNFPNNDFHLLRKAKYFYEAEYKLMKIQDYCFLREKGKDYNYISVFDYINTQTESDKLNPNLIKTPFDFIYKEHPELRIITLYTSSSFIEHLTLKEITKEANELRQKIQNEKTRLFQIEQEEKRKLQILDKWNLISVLVKFEIHEKNKNSYFAGIYMIHCIPTNQFYIGSSNNMIVRKNQHLSSLKTHSHHSYKLQSEFDKFGEIKFKFYVLEIIDLNSDVVNSSKFLKQVEQYYIDKFKPDFNIEQDAFGKRHY